MRPISADLYPAGPEVMYPAAVDLPSDKSSISGDAPDYHRQCGLRRTCPYLLIGGYGIGNAGAYA